MRHPSRLVKALAIALGLALVVTVGPVWAQQAPKPNILVIWGDDIGYWNVSAYNQGMMGYKTPNIDRIAKEGAMFTDWYGQQSCTAGRAAFITGQTPFRTGLLKVGPPSGRARSSSMTREWTGRGAGALRCGPVKWARSLFGRCSNKTSGSPVKGGNSPIDR